MATFLERFLYPIRQETSVEPNKLFCIIAQKKLLNRKQRSPLELRLYFLIHYHIFDASSGYSIKCRPCDINPKGQFPNEV